MVDDPIRALATDVVAGLLAAGKAVAAAESCTGGWIAKALTDIAGSSGCFGYGIVSYSNDAKVSILGVRPETLDRHGAVSEETVREMAEAALAISGADIAVAVSGIAGPDGGTAAKPVGTVWFAWAAKGAGTRCERHSLGDDRDTVRARAVRLALAGIRDIVRADD